MIQVRPVIKAAKVWIIFETIDCLMRRIKWGEALSILFKLGTNTNTNTNHMMHTYKKAANIYGANESQYRTFNIIRAFHSIQPFHIIPFAHLPIELNI